MLSYAPIDRDRERLVEELDAARQFSATPFPASRTTPRRLFQGRFAVGGVIRSHLVGA